MRVVQQMVHAALALALALVGCGQGAETADVESRPSAILGGTPSPPSQDAVVIIARSSDWDTGFLIAPNLLMTARHFVFDWGEVQPSRLRCPDLTAEHQSLSPDKFTVYTGAHAELDGPFAVARIFTDSELNLCENDIAILELEKPLGITRLALRLDDLPMRGELGTVIGWGSIDHRREIGSGNQRYQIDLTIEQVGPNPLPVGNTGFLQVSEGTFVTAQGGCYGDRGAPFLARTNAVVGLMSDSEPADPSALTNAQSDVRNCDDAHNIFQSLNSQNEWIRSVFAATGQAPWLEGHEPPKALGKSCAGDNECSSMLCAKTASTGFCAARCDIDACPEDLACIGAPGQRICAPKRVEGEASAAASCAVSWQHQRHAPPMMATFIALALSRWRRRARRKAKRIRHTPINPGTP